MFFPWNQFQEKFFVKLISLMLCCNRNIYLPIVLRSFFPWNCRPRHKTWGLFARRRARYISFLTLKSVHSNYYSLKKKMKKARRSLYIIMPQNNRCERGLLDSLIFESDAKKNYTCVISGYNHFCVWYCKTNLDFFYTFQLAMCLLYYRGKIVFLNVGRDFLCAE